VIQDLVKTMKSSMDKAIENLNAELTKVRTGRASTAMLDGIKVDYYGTPTIISQVASVSTPEPKMIVIQPWEVNLLKEIEVALQKSDLGITPMNDGKVIRLKIPALTEERRKDMVKVVKRIAEECKVATRMARRDANDAVKELQKNKKISEDDSKKGGDQIQKITDEYSTRIDQLAASKEKELMTL
jgi:ribosome recycling factor